MAVATTGSITIQQLMRHPYVTRVISRIKSPTSRFQDFFNLGLNSSATDSLPAGIRTGSWDIFDKTRQLGTVRPPKVGPKRNRNQKTGNKVFHIMRMHDCLQVAYEDIINTRPHGARIGTLDRTGQSKITQQIKFMTQRYQNTREWVISRMFRGGYGIKQNADEQYLVELSAGDKDVTFDHPSAHRTQLAVGDSGNNIIDTSWDDPSADIIGQFYALNKAAERISGYPITHCWVNSTTLNQLMHNTDLQAVGGTSFRTWETANYKTNSSGDGDSRRNEQVVTFRAMPWVQFHAYDAVLQKGNALQDSTATTEVDLVIPNGVALMTPEPSADWLGFAEGAEPVVKTVAGPMEIMKGFATWQEPMKEPAGVQLNFLDNFFPVPYNPLAWFYATVNF